MMSVMDLFKGGNTAMEVMAKVTEGKVVKKQKCCTADEKVITDCIYINK